jgi:hypothetical protein
MHLFNAAYSPNAIHIRAPVPPDPELLNLAIFQALAKKSGLQMRPPNRKLLGRWLRG